MTLHMKDDRKACCNDALLRDPYSSSCLMICPTLLIQASKTDINRATDPASRIYMALSNALVHHWNIVWPILFSFLWIDHSQIVHRLASRGMKYFLQRKLVEKVWIASYVWGIALLRCTISPFCPGLFPVGKNAFIKRARFEWTNHSELNNCPDDKILTPWNLWGFQRMSNLNFCL
jgi:hypothetical protein